MLIRKCTRIYADSRKNALVPIIPRNPPLHIYNEKTTLVLLKTQMTQIGR